MTHRERFIATVLGKPVDRAPAYLYWGPWGSAWQRWEREGKPAHLKGFDDVRRFFGADEPPRVVPVQCGPWPAIEQRVLAEDAESVTAVDSWGIVRRNLKAVESMSEFVSFPVRSASDWRRFRDERLDPRVPGRLAGAWREQCLAWMDQGLTIQLGAFPDVGLFGAYRWMLGDEECLVAFFEEPDMVREMLAHLTDLYLAVFEAVVREVRVDLVHLWEDLCGRNGPLMSPALWEEFFAPGYRQIKQFCDEHAIPVMSVDTDGQPELLLKPMAATGVNLMFPFEVAAGCDVADVRRRHPDLAVMGGFDKRVLAVGPDAIDAELDRLRPVLAGGRYIAETDHLIPDDVSWDHFSHYARGLVRAAHDAHGR